MFGYILKNKKSLFLMVEAFCRTLTFRAKIDQCDLLKISLILGRKFFGILKQSSFFLKSKILWCQGNVLYEQSNAAKFPLINYHAPETYELFFFNFPVSFFFFIKLPV